jgi:hypothetical protein
MARKGILIMTEGPPLRPRPGVNKRRKFKRSDSTRSAAKLAITQGMKNQVLLKPVTTHSYFERNFVCYTPIALNISKEF